VVIKRYQEDKSSCSHEFFREVYPTHES
jgi:hypothetical protein